MSKIEMNIGYNLLVYSILVGYFFHIYVYIYSLIHSFDPRKPLCTGNVQLGRLIPQIEFVFQCEKVSNKRVCINYRFVCVCLYVYVCISRSFKFDAEPSN